MDRLFKFLFVVGIVALAVFTLKDPSTAGPRLMKLAGFGNKANTDTTGETAPDDNTTAGNPQATAVVPATSPAPATAVAPQPVAVEDSPEKILTDLTKEKREWPQTVVCREALDFPARIDGQIIGSVKVPAGAPLKLMGVSMNQVTVGYPLANPSSKVIPAEKTNLIAEVIAKRHGARPIH